MQDRSLEQLRAALTREAENAAGAQHAFLNGMLEAIKSLDKLIKNPTNNNREAFRNSLSIVLQQPTVDASVANNPKLESTIKQVLKASSNALQKTHDHLSDRYDKEVIHKAQENVQEIDQDYKSHHRPR